MCDFCSNIITKEEYTSLPFLDRIRNFPKTFIMKNKDKYNLWDDCDDYYYSGVCLYNIKYCPKCGRQLA